MKKTTETRFWDKIHKAGSCWEWTGCVLKSGYGQFFDEKKTYAHRYSYKLYRGEVPVGFDVDHLCRNKKCVNPKHLEAVSHKENIHRSPIHMGVINRSKTHCKNGHPYNEENTRKYGKNGRQCRTCQNTDARLRGTYSLAPTNT